MTPSFDEKLGIGALSPISRTSPVLACHVIAAGAPVRRVTPEGPVLTPAQRPEVRELNEAVEVVRSYGHDREQQGDRHDPLQVPLHWFRLLSWSGQHGPNALRRA
jgi:hypothetical protein